MLYAGFILLTLLMAVTIVAGGYTISAAAITDPVQRRRFRLFMIVILAGWLGYIGIASSAGIFIKATLPPRVVLMLVMPAFAFTAFFFGSGRFGNIIEHIPARWPVYIQAFRIIVELLLLEAYREHMIPREATFEGYNFDILIGLSACFVAAVAFRKGSQARGLVMLFNFAGFATLGVVVFVFISQAYFPSIWHKPANDTIAIGMFPYAYLPGFLMPLAVFMHVLSLVKLRSARKPAIAAA